MSKTESNFMEHLKPLLPAGGDASEREAAAQMLTGLSPEDRVLLAAVQESPYRLITLEQFREFPANTEYFVLEPSIRKVEDVGWRYLAQHLDVLLPPELLDAIDPVPFGNHAMREEQGCFTSRGNVCKRSEGRSCGKRCLRAVGKLAAFPSGREYLFSIGGAAVFHISIVNYL